MVMKLADNYFAALKALGGHRLESPEVHIPYVLTCAATLEYLLNDLVSCFALHHYAGPDASMIAESLYTLSFRKKLEAIPSVVTGNRLVLNRSSASL